MPNCYRKPPNSKKSEPIGRNMALPGASANPAGALSLQLRHFDRRVAEHSPLIWIIGSQEGVDLLCLISWGDLSSLRLATPKEDRIALPKWI